MMGFMVLMFFVIYFAISLWVIFSVLNWAHKNKRSGWWGVLAAFVMYNLVFWDWIPTLIVHKHYCDTQAGFWVYKTPEQWKRENPKLTSKDLKAYGKTFDEWRAESPGMTRAQNQYNGKLIQTMPSEVLGNNSSDAINIIKINKKIFWAFNRVDYFSILPIHKYRTWYFVNDSKEVLAEYVNFGSGYGNPMTTGGIQGFKSWLANNGCNNSKANDVEKKKFDIGFFEEIINLGEQK